MVEASPTAGSIAEGCAFTDAEHERRTLDALRKSLSTIPYYAKQGLPVPAESTSLAEALARLPLLTQAALRTSLPKVWLPEGRDARAELATGALVVRELGSGQARLRILWDRAWWLRQQTRALYMHPRAALALDGAFGAYRDAVLWVPERGTGSCGAGDPTYEDRVEGARLHLNSRQDPAFWSELVMTRMLDELEQHQTVGLLGDPFYLDVLARHAAETNRSLAVTGFVALMRATATAAHRAAIGRVHPHVFAVHEPLETGVLFVEGEDALLHHAPISSYVEYLPARVETPGATDVALLAVTTLDREVQPLVRYVPGDLVQRAQGQYRHVTVGPVASLEGKLDDAIVRPDGAIVTPGAVDRALASVGVETYRVVQRSPDTLEVEVMRGSPEAARQAIGTLASGMRVEARTGTSSAIATDGTYRATTRSFAVDLSKSFGNKGDAS